MGNFTYQEAYRGLIKKKRTYLVFLFVALIFASIVSINVGSSNMTVMESVRTLFGQGTDLTEHIVFSIRMPRVIGGILVGASMGLSGMLIQTIMNNPLASPQTLGITNASAFGANVGLILLARLGLSSSVMVSFISFLAALGCVLLVLMISNIKQTTKGSIILAGVAFGSLFAAGTTIIQYFADDTEIASAVFWTFGDLGRMTYAHIKILGTVSLISFIVFYRLRWSLNAMDLGEETAHGLGINTVQMRNLAILFASLNTGISVAFVGIIGFVGLLAPQITKRIIGDDKRYMLIGTCLMGAVIILISDTVARTIASPLVLPVGAITSFLGAPLFLYILLREN